MLGQPDPVSESPPTIQSGPASGSEAPSDVSAARFRDFAEVASDVLWETDDQFRITAYFAGDPVQVLGLPLSEIIGRTRWEIARADVDSPGWKQHIDDQRAHRAFNRFEFTVAGPDGAVRWVSSSGRPCFDAQGNFQGYRGASTDITAQKEAEAQVRRSARQQQVVAAVSQLALQGVPGPRLSEIAAELTGKTLGVDIVSVLDLSADGRVLRLRGGFGWPPNTVHLRAIPLAVCRPLHEALASSEPVYFPRADFNILPHERGKAGFGLALAIGERTERLGVLAVCGGEERRFDSGDVSFLQSIAFVLGAVSEQRKSEAVMRLRERALEALDRGIMLTDAARFDNPLIYVNPAFERITGYSRSDAIGKNPRFLHGPETSADTIAAIRTAVEAEQNFRGEILNYRKDGGSFWNDLTVSPVRDANGSSTHFVGVISDVSERIQLEAQLRQAQKMEAVGHLTGGIAHDFNNMLAVILGNAEVLVEEAADPEVKATAELVMETAERAAELTQRLLAFGRRQALRPEPIALSAAISSFSGMLGRILGEQIRLEILLPEDLPMALVDRSLFESAILNLCVNARDAMAAGGCLTIETAAIRVPGAAAPARLVPGGYLEVTVRDTGIGMSRDVLSHAFEPFFTTKDVGKGSGLGLAMVYGFVQQSKGDVTIESTPGEGTAIHLFLPEAPPAAARSEDSPAPLATAAPHGRERILLVEDEPEVRRFVARQLAGLGYSIMEAETGAAALQVLASHTDIDLLFSDLVLPGGISGVQLLEKARALRPGLRAVLTTGYTEEFAQFEQEIAEPVLKKPYRRQTLAETMRAALDRPAQED